MITNRESLLTKIRALLNKTMENGCSEAEELAALTKARTMMDAYEVTDAELQHTKTESAIFQRDPEAWDTHNVKISLCGAVGAFCDCAGWRTPKGVITFCGLPSDTEFAIWLVNHLSAFVHKELAAHLMATAIAKGKRRAIINGFVTGCTGRISERLRELVEQAKSKVSSNSRELVVVKSAAVKEAMDKSGIKFRTKKSSARLDWDSWDAGREVGDNATFGRPIESDTTHRLK